MRIQELLLEGITFSPARKTNNNGENIISSMEFEEKIKKRCSGCEGTGLIDYNEDGKLDRCVYCNGEGYYESYKNTAPELQVSNTNGLDILNWLGFTPNSVGYIDYKNLPELMRKLIDLKNQDQKRNMFTKSDTTYRSTSVDQNDPALPKINYGPKMIEFGRSDEQIIRYIDKLIEIIRFAQDHKIGVSWS